MVLTKAEIRFASTMIIVGRTQSAAVVDEDVDEEEEEEESR